MKNESELDSKRDKKFGSCPTCKKFNMNYLWCVTCDLISLNEKKTSGNREIDKINKIIHSQLQSSSYDDNYIELIEEDDIQKGEMLDEGGNGEVYKGLWESEKRYIEN